MDRDSSAAPSPASNATPAASKPGPPKPARSTPTPSAPAPSNEEPWHSRAVDASLAAQGSDATRGLTASEAASRLEKEGPNALVAKKQVSWIWILLHQFKSLIVGLLVIAGGVALAMGDAIEAVAILVVILLNAVIGFGTEWRAKQALDGLRKQTVAVARVLRDGAEKELPASELVPGDIVLLSAGDRVPADARVLEVARLRVDESALTGESVPVDKSSEPVAAVGAIGDRASMVHMGTAVTDGRGTVMVTVTGKHSEMGKIGTLLDDIDERGTPLEAKLAQLSRALLVFVLVLCAVIVFVGWLRGHPILYMIEVGVSLAIAAVPEGLLAVTTMTLAVGMQRMARMNALVRRLPAVESLGSTTVICTDKTGTLTKNEMTVRALMVGGRRLDVEGTGYVPEGKLSIDGAAAATLTPTDPFSLALRIGVLCNDAKLEQKDGAVVVLGDPTEAALVVVAEKAGLARTALEGEYPRTAEVPFDSESKQMVTVHTGPEGKTFAFVKGSPGALLTASVSLLAQEGATPITDAARDKVLADNEVLAGEALRVLGLAYRELPASYTDADLSSELSFVGLVGMIDPLRDEAKATIATCRAAGIRPVMITGDQEATAAEIGRQLGLDHDGTGPDGQGRPLRTIHARELEGLDEAGWEKVVAEAAVFARVSPEHKLAIVSALQRLGHVVAMTGDGVNDAPALRQADIGIAMGIRGTEVAKEASDMVITDDNFATIVRAIEEGRIVVHNILRFIHYLFSSNLAEIVTVFGAILIGWPLPLGVMEILWLNLVTDIFPAMALALEPSAPDMMKRPPRAPDEPLMTPRFAFLILWQGTLLAASTLIAFWIGMDWYGSEDTLEHPGLRHASTMAFMTLAMAQVFHAFSARSQTRSALTSRPFSNPWLWAATAVCILLQLAAVYVPPLRTVLHTVPLDVADWGVIAGLSLAPVVVVELVKLVTRLVSPKRLAEASIDATAPIAP